jgi:hypothetical protein
MWHCTHRISEVLGLINMLWNFLFLLLSTSLDSYLPDANAGAPAGSWRRHKYCSASE